MKRRKMILLATFMTILLMGCSGEANPGDKGNPGDQGAGGGMEAFIEDFREANTITYNVVSEDTFEDDSQGRGSSVGNHTFSKEPYIKSSISINETSHGRTFFKFRDEFNGTSYTFSRFMGEIDPGTYTVDDEGTITLSQEPENLINAGEQTLENMPLSMKQWMEPFYLPLYLMEQNADSFRIDLASVTSSTTPILTYKGEFQPDTLVDYFIHDGNAVFKEILFVDYQGEMTLEAIQDAAVKNNFNMLSDGLMALLFSEEPIQVSFSKNMGSGTYELIFDMTPAQRGLLDAMYENEVQDVSFVLTESTVKYTNIRLK